MIIRLSDNELSVINEIIKNNKFLDVEKKRASIILLSSTVTDISELYNKFPYLQKNYIKKTIHKFDKKRLNAIFLSGNKKYELRELSKDELNWLSNTAENPKYNVDTTTRAKIILYASLNIPYTKIAILTNRKSGQAISDLVRRFNYLGLSAVHLDKLQK